jgi:hypothetical protein
MNEKYKNLIVIPKHIYLQLKNAYNENESLTNFDKEIKKILNKKNIKDYQKWNLYKYKLLKYKNLLNSKHTQIPTVNRAQMTDEKGTQTKRQSIRRTLKQHQSASIDDEEEIQMPKEEVYSNSRELELNQLEDNIPSFDPNIEKYNINSSDMEVDPEELEMTLHEIAQEELGTRNPNDVRKVNSSMGKSYREFVDRNTNEHIQINVDEAIKKVYKKMNDEENEQFNTSIVDQQQHPPRTSTPVLKKTAERLSDTIDLGEFERPPPKRRYTKRIHPQIYKYRTRAELRNQLTPKEFAELEVDRKTSKTNKLPNWDTFE